MWLTQGGEDSRKQQQVFKIQKPRFKTQSTDVPVSTV